MPADLPVLSMPRLTFNLAAQWRGPLARIAAVWTALVLAFIADWTAMAGQWWNSSTYNHILLVPGIIGWLVWQRAPQLAQLTPRVWWLPLVPLAGAAFLWVLGAFAGLDLARQLAVVTMLIAAALALLGPRAGWALAFPLAYMLALVPFGDELVPLLQMITADITVALVHLSGIPATIDGVFIDTPAGLFEVAEACSGVKFLIAMIAFGLLVANQCFVSAWRRSLFVAACIVIPIIANGVRAWGTIYAAQHVGIEVAAGFDHIVYGWIFFALVIALILALGWRFFDRRPDDSAVDVAAIERSALLGRLERFSLSHTGLMLAMVLLLLAAKGWAHAAHGLAAPMPARIDLPEVPGWTRAPYAPSAAWGPRAHGADHRLLGSYVDADGRRIDVFFALYAAQDQHREAGGFGEGALTPDSGWAWQSAGPGFDSARSDRLLTQGPVQRLAVTWYRTGDVLTGSNTRLKLANISDRLLLRARPTSMLILSAEERPGFPAQQAVTAFRKAAGPTDAWMDRVAAVR
jgi:exosortase A